MLGALLVEIDHAVGLAFRVGQHAHAVAVGAQFAFPGRQRLGDERRGGVGAGTRGIAVLIPEAGIVVGDPPLVRVGHHGVRQREAIDVHLLAGVVEHLGEFGRRQRRARVGPAAMRRVFVGAVEASASKLPLDLGQEGLEVVIADRPVGQARALQASPCSVFSMKSEGRGRGNQPAQCVVPPPTNCGKRRERKQFGLRILVRRGRCAASASGSGQRKLRLMYLISSPE